MSSDCVTQWIINIIGKGNMILCEKMFFFFYRFLYVGIYYKCKLIFLFSFIYFELIYSKIEFHELIKNKWHGLICEYRNHRQNTNWKWI